MATSLRGASRPQGFKASSRMGVSNTPPMPRCGLDGVMPLTRISSQASSASGTSLPRRCLCTRLVDGITLPRDSTVSSPLAPASLRRRYSRCSCECVAGGKLIVISACGSKMTMSAFRSPRQCLSWERGRTAWPARSTPARQTAQADASSRHAAVVDQAQAVFDARPAVGDLTEIILAEFLLLFEALDSDRSNDSASHSSAGLSRAHRWDGHCWRRAASAHTWRPRSRPGRSASRRGRDTGGRSQRRPAAPCHVPLAPSAGRPVRRCTMYTGAPAISAMAISSSRPLGFGFGRAGEGVVLGRRFPLGKRALDELVDDEAIFRMHTDEPTGLAGCASWL